MRAFGIFSIIAAFSAALLVSAAPVGPSDFSVVNSGTLRRGVDIPNVLGSVTKRQAPSVSVVDIDDEDDVVRRTNIKSVPAIVAGVTARIEVVAKKLDAALVGHVDVDVVVGLLVEVKDILIAAVAEVKALVGLSLDVILSFDGKVLAVADVAVCIAGLIHLIVAIIVKVQAVISAAVVIQLCVDISVALAAFLGATFSIVAGLLVAVVPLLADITAMIKGIKIFVSLVAVLGL